MVSWTITISKFIFKFGFFVNVINHLTIAILTGTYCWTYEEQSKWSRQFPSCGGVRQSPINIKNYNLLQNKSMDLEFRGYQRNLLNYTVVNNGHSVQFNFIGTLRNAPFITGSALNNQRFSLAQFHFHWGASNGRGSEHLVDGIRYDGELHLVHFNSDRFENFQQAIKEENGVVVLAIFLQVCIFIVFK